MIAQIFTVTSILINVVFFKLVFLKRTIFFLFIFFQENATHKANN